MSHEWMHHPPPFGLFLPLLLTHCGNNIILCAVAFVSKNRPLQRKCCVIDLNVVQHSRVSRSPHWQMRVACSRRRRQAAVTPEASRANQAPAQVHHMPEGFFCASPSAASANAPQLLSRGMFSVWASAPHVPLCGVRVPATGHCACRYAHDRHVVELG
jgi:hypothetical protein